MKTLILLLLLYLSCHLLYGQSYNLNSSTNGQTYNSCNATLFDDGGSSGNYSNSQNYEVTFHTTGNGCIRAVIEEYDIEENFDFLYFYDGPNSSSPQINSRVTGYPFVSGTHRNETGNAYYAQSGYITIRFFADGLTVRGGFNLKIDCPSNCLAPSCTGTTPAGEYCDLPAPICDFNGYCGNTSTAYPTDHAEIDAYNLGIFCGGINNNSWLSFVANATTAVLDVWVYNCQGSPLYAGNPIMGIQLQVYETDCSYGGFTPKSNCWSPAKEVNGQIIASGLTIGNTYLLMIDGFAQDNCQYKFAASSGLIVADAGSDQTICEGESVSLTASGGPNVIWSATPIDPSLIGQENNLTISVSPAQTTTYTASVSGSNPNCPGTADVVVFVDAAAASFTGLDSYYCENSSSVVLTGNYPSGVFSGSGIAGNTFNPSSLSPGNYYVTYSYNYSVVTAFFDDFDPWPDPGWIHGANSGTSSWAHGTPLGGDGSNLNIYSNSDPLTDHSSNLDNKVWGQGLSSTDGSGLGGHNNSSDEWLKSPAIDCSTLSNTVLSFWRYANFETSWDESYVQISTNGSSFTNLTSEPFYPQDDHWVHRIINISQWADGQPTVYIRFRSISDGSQTYSGWNVDDFSITGVEAGGSCTSTYTQATTVQSLPTVNAGIDAGICSGQAYTLNGSISGGTTTGTWSTSGSGTFNNSSSLNAVYTPSSSDISNGSVNLTLTSSDPSGPCNATSDIVLLTINPLDNASFSYSSGTFCQTASDPSPSITTPGGTFTFSPAGLIINSGTGLIDLSASTAQTYTVTYTTNGTCPNSSSVSLTITTGFDAEFSYSGPYCQGSSNPLPTHTTGSNGTYTSVPAGLVFVNTSTGEINLTSSSPGTYTITNTISASGGCTAATYNNSVTIDQAPVVSAGADATICDGNTFIPAGSVGGSTSNINWSTSGDGTFLYGSTTTPTYTPGSNDLLNGSVILTITSNDPSGPCNAATDNLMLTINPSATVFAGTDVIICENESYQIPDATVTGVSGISWSSSGDGNFNNSSVISPVYTPGSNDISNQSVNLTITTDDPDGSGPCTAATDQLTLTINQAAYVYAGQDTSICEGQSFAISNASMSGSANSISWTTSGDGSFSNTAILNPVYTPGLNDIINGSTLLSIISNNPTGPCDADSNSFVLKINTTPLFEVLIDSSDCSQANGSLCIVPDGNAAPYTYYWNSGATDSLLIDLTSGTYYFTITDGNGCTNDSAIYLADIGAGNLSISILSNILCHGDSTGAISASVTGGSAPFTYLWSNGSTSDSIQNIIAGSYFVTVFDASGCELSDFAIISQPAQPLITTINIQNISCYGINDGTVLINITGGTSPYFCNWNDEVNSTDINGLSAGVYYITITDANACIKTDTVIITQPDALVATISVSKPTCDGNSDGSVVVSVNGGSIPYFYSWNTGLQTADSLINDLANGNYSLTVSDANSCVSVYSIILESSGEGCLLIPNLFTPNGDSYNDTWEIKGVQFYPEIYIEIYNRWGDVIFKSTGYDEPWDGTYNGSQIPMGSYVYIIDLKNGEEAFNGVVSIKR
ncbi:MAG: gliding motility-associated C-terminal domain-containing protein [Bacteroidota bacterium]